MNLQLLCLNFTIIPINPWKLDGFEKTSNIYCNNCNKYFALGNNKDSGNFIYTLDITYVIGNSVHFLSLAITDQGVMIKDEKRRSIRLKLLSNPEGSIFKFGPDD